MNDPVVGANRSTPREMHVIEDKAAGLQGIVAIDSLTLGPAAGGCRLWRYGTLAELHADAVRLARGMTYKNAMAGLPFGGGKAVLQMPEGTFDRTALFGAFGAAVQELSGRYVTAEDVGTGIADMQAVRHRTAFVAGLDRPGGLAGGDPSPWTARGVFQAMTIAAQIALGTDPSRLHVAIQGAGNVGSHLCTILVEAGARVTVADTDAERCRSLARLPGVAIAAPETIAGIDADVYAPCALGGALDEPTVDRLKARLVCGGANNQIAADPVLEQLAARGVTYVPDYVANAGGIINVAAEYLGETTAQVAERVDRIGSRVRAILTRAQEERRSPALVADAMVDEILAGGERIAA